MSNMTEDEFIAATRPLARSVAGRVAAEYRAQGFAVDVDDAYSGALFGAWKAAQRYRPNSRTQPTTWAYPWCTRYARIEANRAAGLSASRGNGLVGVDSLEAVADRGESKPDPYALDGNRVALNVAVRQAVAELPDTERKVVYLTYWHGLRLAEVGAIVGLSKTGVRYALARAHDRLRAALADD